jgi:hypothetical protein
MGEGIMIEQLNTVRVTCDGESHFCWEEMLLSIEPGETKKDAIEFLKNLGWEIEPQTEIVGNSIKIYNYYCVCPFCAKGIMKEDVENEEGNLEISDEI